jgi:hypothetical protein
MIYERTGPKANMLERQRNGQLAQLNTQNDKKNKNINFFAKRGLQKKYPSLEQFY